MKNILTIARKEFLSYFHSWLGVLICLFFFLISGLFFMMMVLSYAKLSMDAGSTALQASGMNQTYYIFGSFYVNLSTILIFLIPLLTMRSFAEEKREQTLELLFTYPISDLEVVLGKITGLVWIFELLLIPILGYPLIFKAIGGQFDWTVVLLGFVGFWLLGNFYIAMGVYISSLTKSTMISALVSFSFFILFWVFEWVAKISDGAVAEVFRHLSPLNHYRFFTIGHVYLEHIAYFLLLQALFFVLTYFSIGKRNWRA